MTTWSERARSALQQACLRLAYLAVGVLRAARWVAWEVLARRLTSVSVDRPRSEPEDAFVRSIDARCVVEPKYGWAIVEPSTLVTDSLTFGWGTHRWRGREWVGLPTVTGYLRRSNVVEVDRAVSICSPWPENYYHFVMDVLPKIPPLLDAGLIADRPVLIPTELSGRRFFQEASQLGRLADIDFVALDGRYHRTGSLAYAYGGPYDRIDFARLHDLLAIDGHFPLPDDPPERRVFITRHPRRGRVPTNIAEIDELFVSHGFEIVDLDEYGFGEQVELFRTSSHIAAIHGAALANLVWSSPRLTTAMEIVPRIDDGSFDCFAELAPSLGIDFSRVIGSNETYAHKRADFDVSMPELEASIEQFVAPPVR